MRRWLLIVALLFASPAWGQQITISGQYTASGKRETASQVTLYATDFESDDPDLVPSWERATPTYATLNTNPSFAHGGSNSGSFRYAMSAGAPGSADHTVWAGQYFTAGSHVFVRAWVYFKSPADAQKGKGAQRKLICVSDNVPGYDSWEVILTSYETTSGPPSTIALAFVSQGGGCFGSQDVDWMGSVYDMNWDTWYALEIEVQTNTPSASPPYDGIVRVWRDGVLKLERTDFKVNGNCSTQAAYVSMGWQMNRYLGEAVDEYRYWDDVRVSTSYIGP